VSPEPSAFGDSPHQKLRPLVVDDAGAKPVLVGLHGYLFGDPAECVNLGLIGVLGDDDTPPVSGLDLASASAQVHPVIARTGLVERFETLRHLHRPMGFNPALATTAKTVSLRQDGFVQRGFGVETLEPNHLRLGRFQQCPNLPQQDLRRLLRDLTEAPAVLDVEAFQRRQRENLVADRTRKPNRLDSAQDHRDGLVAFLQKEDVGTGVGLRSDDGLVPVRIRIEGRGFLPDQQRFPVLPQPLCLREASGNGYFVVPHVVDLLHKVLHHPSYAGKRNQPMPTRTDPARSVPILGQVDALTRRTWAQFNYAGSILRLSRQKGPPDVPGTSRQGSI
jgi:hypothetical protein